MFPKKSFSQNFLRDESVLRRIAEEINPSDTILEIGAGEGALTEELGKRARNVIALEFDHELIPGLLRRFPLSSNVSIVEADILHADIPSLIDQKELPISPSSSSPSKISSESRSKSEFRQWSIFGNIPYGITGKIIRLLVALNPAPDKIILMVQKEVAERIVAKNGKQSLLSLSVALFGHAEILFTVSRNAFFPAPEVESAVIRITPNPGRLQNETRERILHLAKIGFAAKRKTLANNFATHPEFSKETIERLLEHISKSKNARAEELSAEEWERLQRSIPTAHNP